MTHEWEGFGGCTDIAENNKLGGSPNWAKAKLMHKRMMNKLLARPFTIIFCLRARDKVKQEKVNGKMEYTPEGMQPIQEKNFKFEMLVATMLDEHTKRPMPSADFHKVPQPLLGIFQGDRFITPEDGRKIREWVNGGMPVNHELETLKRDCRDAAHNGTEALKNFWLNLSDAKRTLIESYKDECKLTAQEVDQQLAEQAKTTTLTEQPDKIF
jgi:hypothetical protein